MKDSIPGDDSKLFPEVELPFSKSKDEVWSELSLLMQQRPTPEMGTPPMEMKSRRLHWVSYAAAAVFVLVLASSAVAFLYTKTVYSPVGSHLTALLPDGSSVELNAGSVIKYKPYWWQFNRIVDFEGEAFFKVTKGKSFEVVSTKGRTMVLGTSFNIYSRKDEYKVTCYTGKVRVVSIISGHSTDITPNEQAEINTDGTIALRTVKNVDETISWMNDMFIFTGTPLAQVFEEIERQYGITITTSEKLNYLYTGNFTRYRTAEEVVKMVCRPLGLYYKSTANGYRVSKTELSE